MIALIFFVFVATITIYYLWKWKKLRGTLPPGPFPLPVFGNLLQLDRRDIRKSFVKWYKEYRPIYTVWFGTEPHVFVCDYDLLQDMFVKQGELFTDRPLSMVFHYSTKGKYGIINSNGEQWREQRRFVLQVLRNFGLGRQIMEEKITIEIDKLIWSIRSKLGGENKKVLNLQQDIDLCVGNVISSILVGKSYQPDDKTFSDIKHSIDNCFHLLASIKIRILNNFTFLRFVPLFGNFGFNELKEHTERFLEIIYSELTIHKNEVKKSIKPNDFTAAYLEEMNRRKLAGENMDHFSEWQLVCIMRDLWMAGLETTTTTLQWGILFMMHHPEIQRKVQDEINDVLGFDKPPTMADKTQLPYTVGVIQEIQRCGNIVHLNIPRTVQQDLKLNGYILPKGVPILPQISVLMLDDKYFPRPDEFDPDHFLEADGKILKKVDEMMPFSLGKRTCLGEGLARMELFLIFVSLMQKFTFSVPAGSEAPSLDPVLGLTMSPKPYNVQVTLRSSFIRQLYQRENSAF